MEDIITGTISGLISSIIMLFIDKQTIIGLFKDNKNVQKLENAGISPQPYYYYSSSYSYRHEIKITEKYKSPTSSDDSIAYLFLLIFPIIAFIVIYISFIERITLILYWIIATIIFLAIFTFIRYLRTKSRFPSFKLPQTLIPFSISVILPLAVLIYFLIGYKSVSRNGINIIDISQDVNQKTTWDFSALSKTLDTFTNKYNFLKENYIEFTPVFTITLLGMLLATIPILFAVRNIKSFNSLLTASLENEPKQKIVNNAAFASPKIFWFDSIITIILFSLVYILLSGYWEIIIDYVINWFSN